MTVSEILLVVTMDCERARTETRDDASGPPDYASSARWIEAYDRLNRDRGLPVSYFVHPEAAVAHPSLFRDLAQDGACLGLHLHPWKFGDGRWKAHFGGMTAAEQREILIAASGIHESALRQKPLYFRPGTFSANDMTYTVLAELGFRGGSISAPERFYRELCAIWIGAPADPHRGHAAFRQLAGTLPFADMPLTVDLSEILEKNGRRFCRDLRPDYQEADYEAIAGNIVGQIAARAPKVPVINIVTHNDNDYSNLDERVPHNFVRALDAVFKACDRRSIRVKGATMATVADLVLEVPTEAVELQTVGIIHGARTAAQSGR